MGIMTLLPLLPRGGVTGFGCAVASLRTSFDSAPKRSVVGTFHHCDKITKQIGFDLQLTRIHFTTTWLLCFWAWSEGELHARGTWWSGGGKRARVRCALPEWPSGHFPLPAIPVSLPLLNSAIRLKFVKGLIHQWGQNLQIQSLPNGGDQALNTWALWDSSYPIHNICI